MPRHLFRIEPFQIKNAKKLVSWMESERFQAIWCANTFAWPLTVEAIQEMLDLCASDAPHRQLLQVVNPSGEMVGFFGIRRIDSRGTAGHLSLVIVSPDCRGEGVGKAMVKAALDHGFLKQGFSRVQLKVFHVNPAAHKCYEACGMTPWGPKNAPFHFKGERWEVTTLAKEHKAPQGK